MGYSPWGRTESDTTETAAHQKIAMAQHRMAKSDRYRCCWSGREDGDLYVENSKEVFLLAHWIMGCLLGC